MDALATCHRYFEAWRQRDAGAVLETLAPGGTYQDPTTAGPLTGGAFLAYMQGLWAAFPDLDFELGRVQGLDVVGSEPDLLSYPLRLPQGSVAVIVW